MAKKVDESQNRQDPQIFIQGIQQVQKSVAGRTPIFGSTEFAVSALGSSAHAGQIPGVKKASW